MLEYVDEADPDRPFFGYLAFQAIHLPVQVPPEYIDKYDGAFDRGWDVMREERLQKAIELGLVPEGTRLSDAAHNSRSWDEPGEEEKAYWSRVMQVNAGMMEAADFHLGRLLDHLQTKGQLDNTIVVVTSDNGPEYNTLGKTSPPASLAVERAWMAIEGWDVTYQNLGQPGSMGAIGQEWASVSAAPFHLFKFNASEGGLRVPMVVSGPGIETLGFVGGRSQVADIAPTLLDAAGVTFTPDEFYGRSLMPMLTGQADEVYGEEDSIAFEVSGTAALYRGNWKIAKTPEPFGDGEWHLYDIASDPGETTDVAAQHPVVFQEMLNEYQSYANEVGVFEMAAGDSARKQLTINGIKKFSANYWYVLLAFLAALAATLYGMFRMFKLVVGRRPARHERT